METREEVPPLRHVTHVQLLDRVGKVKRPNFFTHGCSDNTSMNHSVAQKKTRVAVAFSIAKPKTSIRDWVQSSHVMMRIRSGQGLFLSFFLSFSLHASKIRAMKY